MSTTDIEKYQKYLARQRKAAKKYYDSKLKPTENMTESEKEILAERLKVRREHYKNKYAENKEYYKQKAAEYRLRKKNELEHSAALQATNGDEAMAAALVLLRDN